MRRFSVRNCCATIVSLAVIALSLAPVVTNGASPTDQQRPGNNRQQPTQKRSANNASTKQPIRTAQAKSPSNNLAPADALDPDQKAQFQKLIGANWIWSPAYPKDAIPVGDCYFRKTIVAGNEIEFAQVHVACDNQYEL